MDHCSQTFCSFYREACSIKVNFVMRQYLGYPSHYSDRLCIGLILRILCSKKILQKGISLTPDMRNLHEFIPTFVPVSFAPNQPEMIANRLVSTRSCNRKTIPSKSLKVSNSYLNNFVKTSLHCQMTYRVGQLQRA